MRGAWVPARALLLAASLLHAHAARPADFACATRADLVGPCTQIRARLSFWNGAPSARLWPVGTRRMLGVRDETLPRDLAPPVTGFDTDAWARFTVCPLTAPAPGRMQIVCIERWSGLELRPHRAGAAGRR